MSTRIIAGGTFNIGHNSSDLFYQCRFLTPQDISYDRNHGPIPHIRTEKHVVRIDGHVKKPISFSPDQLLSEFPQHEVVCALECAGNRRHTMRTMLRQVEGIDWGDAAVMNCKFKGPRIRDVLLHAGLEDDIMDSGRELHVAFACYQVPCQEDHWFGSSVMLERCMREDGDAILALKVSKFLPFDFTYVNTAIGQRQASHCQSWPSCPRGASWHCWCALGQMARSHHRPRYRVP